MFIFGGDLMKKNCSIAYSYNGHNKGTKIHIFLMALISDNSYYKYSNFNNYLPPLTFNDYIGTKSKPS
jgi:hypothetical protein